MCKGTFFQNLMKIIIVILCVYIGVRCVSIMTKEDIKDILKYRLIATDNLDIM